MKKTFSEFLTAKNIDQSKFDGMSAEEKAGLYNEYNTELKAYIETLEKNVDDKASKDELQKAIAELNAERVKQMETLNNALSEMGMAIKASSEKSKDGEENVTDLRKALNDHVDRIKAMKDGKDGFSFTVKAPATMLGSTNVSGGNVPVEQRVPGLNIVASRQVKITDLFARGTANSNIISWVYQANKDGAAGGTAEGDSKNQIDFDLVVASQALVKRTAFIKVSTEMLEDIDFIESEIRNELMRELMKDLESTSYSGDGIAPNMNGVRTVATAFAAGASAGAIDNANEVDVLGAAVTQILEANHPMPNAILMHPRDVYQMKSTKVTSTDRRYVERLAMVGGNLNMDGIPIIESTLVTAGQYLVGSFDMATLYTKGAIRIEMGLDGNDYTKNLRTILAEVRGALVVKNNDRTAFVKGVFSTDKAALETP